MACMNTYTFMYVHTCMHTEHKTHLSEALSHKTYDKNLFFFPPYYSLPLFGPQFIRQYLCLATLTLVFIMHKCLV